MAGDERAVRLTAGGCGKLWQLNNLRVLKEFFLLLSCY